MGLLKGFINVLADPKLYFILAVVALVVMVWKREKVASNVFGYTMMGLLTVFFVFGAVRPAGRSLSLERNPLGLRQAGLREGPQRRHHRAHRATPSS